ncbi:MAG TPA: hypothetical protein VGJ33_16480 [Candidatus Angelobacter sp.]
MKMKIVLAALLRKYSFDVSHWTVQDKQRKAKRLPNGSRLH